MSIATSCPARGRYMLWQATICPGDTSRRAGHVSAHSGVARVQRVLNGQPEGRFMGLGTSPYNTMRLFCLALSGSGMGTAESSDVV